jgi:hypothetical protein
MTITLGKHWQVEADWYFFGGAIGFGFDAYVQTTGHRGAYFSLRLPLLWLELEVIDNRHSDEVTQS